MSVQERDIKILWGKAAGRCSMPDCRVELMVEASDSVPSNNILIGKNCHIIAEKEGGPRGKSILTLEERNRYPNLILLCSNHHDIIDNDPKSWPIEKLHQIKAEHELWVETQLTQSDSEELKLYSDLVNIATDKLMLSKWDWLSDHAVRLLLNDEFVEGVNDFWYIIQKRVWPKKLPDLEENIVNLCERVSEYVQHFTSSSILRKDGLWHAEDKRWKGKWRDDYDYYAEKSKKWQDKSTCLLFNVVVALNEFADSVRKHLNPNYMLYEGKFIISDPLGVISEMEPSIHIPSEYIEINNNA